MVKNPTYKRMITDQVTIKGVLSEDRLTIKVEDKDSGARDVKLEDYLGQFSGEYMELTIKTKSETDLDSDD